MKKALIFITMLFGSIGMACAQDIITTKDGSDIQARILEVTNSEIKYKRFSNLEGPTFTISKSDILIIRYENGENEVFKESDNRQDPAQNRYNQTQHQSRNTPNNRYRQNAYGPNTDAEIWEGMSFREYAPYYNHKYYVKQLGDPYSPVWCGIASAVIPGLGECIAGEWALGLGTVAANMGLWLAMNSSFNNGNTTLGYVFFGCRLGLDIYSIFDAVIVARIKNMYWQDINSQHYSFNLDIEPLLTCAPAAGTPNNMQTVAGLSVRFSF